MSFGISGFGGVQIDVAPQIFQALSLGGASPRPPAPPYGTPNANLVPVVSTGNPVLPANLTLAAHPVFAAILKLTGASVQSVQHPALSSIPFTTTAIGATNPRVTNQIQGPPNAVIPTIGNVPQGPVSFALTVSQASFTSGLGVVGQSRVPVQPPSSTRSIPPPAPPSAVAKIAQTVRALAVSAAYSAPVFSFKA